MRFITQQSGGVAVAAGDVIIPSPAKARGDAPSPAVNGAEIYFLCEKE